MNRKKTFVGTKFSGVAKASQATVERMEAMPGKARAYSGLAKVLAVYPDRMTCDIEGWNGFRNNNVPIRTRGGLIDEEVWGEMELPSVDGYVIVEFIEGKESFPYITGTILPYGYSKFQSNQTPVNSANKQFTLKLLEEGKENYFRKIFRSGTTFEVQDNGTVILEVPTGTYIEIDEENEEIVIEDAHGNIITIDTNGILMTDTNGNSVRLNANGVIVDDDVNSNTITMSSSGMTIQDKNNNTISMQSGKVVINNNLEVLQ